MQAFFTRTRTAAAAALAVATLAAGTAAFAQSNDGKDRRVQIINETRETLVRFYASRISTSEWEEDILGDKVLRPGESVRMNIDDGTGACLFDFKAEFSDGDVLIRNRINVCEITQYRYTQD